MYKNLARVKEKYTSLSKEGKEEFDLIKLTNPYSDSRILVDTGRKTIKKCWLVLIWVGRNCC